MEQVVQQARAQGREEEKIALLTVIQDLSIEELLTSENETIRQLVARILKKVKEDCNCENANLSEQTAQA